MFFDRLKQLCDNRNISIYKAATEVGLNRAAANKWKGGSIPNGQTVSRLADFFGVTTDYLIGEEKEKAPALNERDRRDIAKNLEQMLSDLESNGDLMFDGDPMSDEARASIRQALQMGLEIAKVKNKERFTPKKYREG